MISTSWSMLNAYSIWTFSSTVLVSVAAFGAMAVVYKKVLKAPSYPPPIGPGRELVPVE
jgi:hypothetical protein